MKIAFVFPGQGSQSVGMMKSFAQLPGVRDTFSQASDAIGQDVWKLVEQGPAEELNLTVNTQPVMLTAGIALYRAWRAQFDRHRAIARWTYPIWLYVSVTGVIVYLMLYWFFPRPVGQT